MEMVRMLLQERRPSAPAAKWRPRNAEACVFRRIPSNSTARGENGSLDKEFDHEEEKSSKDD